MGTLDTLKTVTSWVGAAWLTYAVYTTTTFVWTFVRPSRLHRYNHSSPWALVTGASDGIGLGFIQELLARDFDVLLHGRNETKLRRIQGELSNQYPKRSVDIVIADAAAYGNSYEAVIEKVKTLPGKLT